MTFDEAEIYTRSLEVILGGTPEGNVFYCALSAPRTPENWPLNWFVNPSRGRDVCLVIGDGATATEARLWAAGRIVDSSTWRPDMNLREAERGLYPGLSALDDERASDPGAS